MKLRFLAFAAAFLAATALFAVYNTYLSVPENVPSGVTYDIYGETTVDIQDGYTTLVLYKGGSYFADTGTYGDYRLYMHYSATDFGTKTVQWDLYAEDGLWNETATAYVNIYVPPQAPRGVFESASDSIPRGENLFSSGWAADFEMGAPVSRLDFYIDGNPAGQANLGGSRPDVQAAKSSWDDPWPYCTQNLTPSGWSLAYATGGLAVGPHTIRMVAVDNQNLSTDLGTKTFVVNSAAPQPSTADSDGDGMSDAWEIAHGLNPMLNDANGDLDCDGMSNLAEFLAGRDPLNPNDAGTLQLIVKTPSSGFWRITTGTWQITAP